MEGALMELSDIQPSVIGGGSAPPGGLVSCLGALPLGGPGLGSTAATEASWSLRASDRLRRL